MKTVMMAAILAFLAGPADAVVPNEQGVRMDQTVGQWHDPNAEPPARPPRSGKPKPRRSR